MSKESPSTSNTKKRQASQTKEVEPKEIDNDCTISTCVHLDSSFPGQRVLFFQVVSWPGLVLFPVLRITGI